MQPDRPDPAIDALTRAYGPPSSAAFGSAVFHEHPDASEDLEEVALRVYRRFVGGLWQRFGEGAWMGAWRLVYRRPVGAGRDVVAELRALGQPATASSVDMILDVAQGADRARTALAGVFDAETMTDVRAFSIGDGSAMSGILVAGQETNGDVTIIVFLMD